MSEPSKISLKPKLWYSRAQGHSSLGMNSPYNYLFFFALAKNVNERKLHILLSAPSPDMIGEKYFISYAIFVVNLRTAINTPIIPVSPNLSDRWKQNEYVSGFITNFWTSFRLWRRFVKLN